MLLGLFDSNNDSNEQVYPILVKVFLEETSVCLMCVIPLVVDWLIMRWSFYYREIHEDEKVEQALTDGK